MKVKRVAKLAALIAVAVICMAAAFALDSRCESCYAAACTGGYHMYAVELVKHATDSSDGLRRFTCTKCGDTYDEAIPKIGHDWGKWIRDVEPSEGKSGRKHRTCKNDPDHIQVARIAPLPVGTATVDDEGDAIIETITIDGTEDLPDEDIDEEEQDGEEDAAGTGEDSSEDSGGDSGATGGSGASGGAGQGGSGDAGEVPLGIADAAIAGAGGAVSIFYLLLLLPLVRVMFWIAKKKREAEEEK